MATLYQYLPMSSKVTTNTSDDVILFQFLGVPINTIFRDTTCSSQFLIGNLRILSHQSNDFVLISLPISSAAIGICISSSSSFG